MLHKKTIAESYRGKGSGFRVQGSGFRVRGSGFRVQLIAGFSRIVSPLAGKRESLKNDKDFSLRLK